MRVFVRSKVSIMLGLMLGYMVLFSYGVVEASSVDGKCSITIDANKHVDQNFAYGTGKCKERVMGVYGNGNYSIFGAVSKSVRNGQVEQVVIPPFDKYELTVYTVSKKEEEKKEIEPEHKLEKQEPVEVEAKKIKKKEERKEVVEKKKEESKKEGKEIINPDSGKESKIYTVEELQELQDEERVSFNGNNNRYYVIIDESREQEISEEVANELGYIDTMDVEDIEKEENNIEEVNEEEVVDKEYSEEENKGTKGNIIVLVIVVVVTVVGFIFVIPSIRRRNSEK